MERGSKGDGECYKEMIIAGSRIFNVLLQLDPFLHQSIRQKGKVKEGGGTNRAMFA